MLLLVLWMVVVYIMWLKGHLDLEQRSGGEVPARFKAVLDLAAALHDELSSVGEKVDSLTTNRQLDLCITKRLSGGRVAVQTPFPATKYSFRKGAWSWIKREKWWFTWAVVSIIILSVCPVSAPLAAGVFLALAIGRTRGSRVLISICGLILALVSTASLVGLVYA
jgi:hypothetical protein